MMTGHCRILTQALSACELSQIPAPMMGIERSTATKFMAPMTLLLSAIFFFFGLEIIFWGDFSFVGFSLLLEGIK